MVAAAVAVCAAVALGASAAPAPRSHAGSTARPLTFGIYPGGGAGTVGPAGRTLAEDPGKRLAALRQLRVPGRPFVLHLFATYDGPGSASAASEVAGDVAQYTSAGFDVELVLTYRPHGGTTAANVAGFAEFARRAVDSFGPDRRFVALQITNEANIANAPNAADGAYAGAQDALIDGVVAAKAETRVRKFSISVGFNWAYSREASEAAFWSRLGRVGGPSFRRSVDWVGLDVYPQTWGPRASGNLATATRTTMRSALRALRNRFLPLAKLPSRVRLHISENGYPTGPGRTEAMQVTALGADLSTVNAYRAEYRITDYRWFDLRDADSSSTSFESRYGLMHDDYTAKPAFAAYRALIAKLGR